ncbi:hypothetical protein [Ostreiculturibacter nitratireducens]|uniref:hypothetical protein n=1 Tax=Ostreiculturibacter nitratireducens TaxID=3075226 RepID=UPI0031B5ED58
MFAALKIVHLFCLLAGGAASIGNAVLMRRVARLGAPPPPIVPEVMGVLARMGLGAIVLLWITGVLMIAVGPGTLALGWEFYVKLLGAAVVLGIVSLMSMIRARAAAERRPPDPKRMRTLSRIAFAGTSTAIIFAVLAFA